MVNKNISLEDIFKNHCDYIQCVHNYNGECDYGDHVSRYLTYQKGDKFATCNGFELKYGYCECGKKLTEVTQRLPYGDTHIPHTYFKCLDCEGD